MAETHRQARELLQLLVNEPGEDVIDISTQWATWRIYLACHPKSEDLVGPGVVAVEARRIPGTTDPHRFGRQRLDFFICRLDGSVCRLHLGTKMKDSAKPCYGPAPSLGPCTLQQIRQIPQVDRLSKNDAFNWFLQRTWLPDEDITDGSRFPWKNFVANLEKTLAPDIMENGVTQVRVLKVTTDRVTMTFRHYGPHSSGTTKLCLQQMTSRWAVSPSVTVWLP